MKVVVDRSKCAGLGLCEAVAPDIFEVQPAGDMVVHDDAVTDDRRTDVDDAVEGCPMLALSVES
ncbi:ferredoxin [Jatrophihabitans endophyticus]|uniref:ferredoxin n=1 Tax=Jatrophihabitans endophyticus TaxID=1206085 RepID=UPI0019E4CFA8|nr:ferredoxin [Jatrophihabitans endophyticus]MBE7188529.1 ferredoxin [Jatrophihabitans endophyticus]